MSVLLKVLEICLIPLVGALTTLLIAYIDAKTKEIQSKMKTEKQKDYIGFVSDIVVKCVTTTNQTYVNSLKEQGKFDAEAQKEAFQRSFNAVMEILSIDSKEILEESIDNLDVFVTTLIETEIKAQKGES